MKIVDNFLPQEYWERIHNIVTSTEFPWYLNKTTSYKYDEEPQMTHTYYADNQINSEVFSVIQPMMLEFQLHSGRIIKDIHRIKSNLSFNRTIPNETIEKLIHQDMNKDNYMTLLYYVTDSDGDTILYEDDKKTELLRVTPKANRAIIFNSNIWHTGLLPVKHKTRCIINFVLECTE